MPVDYAALAEQARQTAAPPVDYAALADQARQPAKPRAFTIMDAKLDAGRGRDDAGELPPDTGTVARWFETTLRPMLEQVAHPQTISDIAQLLIPDANLAGAVRAGKDALTRARAAAPSAQQVGQGAVEAAKAVLHPKALADRVIKAVETRLATPPAAPAFGTWKGPPPTVNESLVGALNDARQAPVAPATAARLPEYPQAAVDSMRSVAERGPIAAREALTRPPASAPIAPVASHTPTPPAAALRNLNDAPAVTSPVTPAQAAAERVLQFNPSKVLAEVKDTFTKLGETPLRAEASNAMELMRRGVPAEEAVKRVITMRPPASAIEDLAARLKQPTDATVKARVASRNSSGRWTE